MRFRVEKFYFLPSLFQCLNILIKKASELQWKYIIRCTKPIKKVFILLCCFLLITLKIDAAMTGNATRELLIFLSEHKDSVLPLKFSIRSDNSNLPDKNIFFSLLFWFGLGWLYLFRVQVGFGLTFYSWGSGSD